MQSAQEWSAESIGDGLARRAVTSVMNPARLGSVSPALLTGHIWSSQQLTLTGNFQVDDTNIGASTGRVSTQDNVIIYAPTQGWDDMVLRYGRVPTGVTILENQFGFSAYSYPLSFNPVITSLTFDAPMIMPYSNTNPKDQVVITPALTRNFMYSNPYNGVVVINSTEEALTNVVVSGRMTAVALASDIGPQRRDNGAFDPTDLTSISLTSKDVQPDVPVKQGVVLLQGPDVSTEFRPVAQLQEDMHKKLWLAGDQGDYNLDRGFYSGALGQVPGVTYDVIVNQDGRGKLMGCWWVSPYQTTSLFTYHGQNILTPAIGLQDTLDVEIWTCPGYLNNGAASANIIFTIQYTAYFATVSSNHEITFTAHYAEEELYSTGLRNGNTGVAPFEAYTPSQAYVKKTISTRDWQGPQNRVGIFVGLNINIIALQQHGFVAGTTDLRFDPIRPTRFRFAAHEGSDMNTVGPIRVCAMDSVSNGSLITCQGRFNVQCLARDVTQELIRDMPTAGREAVSMNFNLFLRQAFKSSSNVFKRVYLRSEYFSIIEQYFKGRNSSSTESLLEATGGDESVIAAGRAAGLFSELGSLAGGLIGSIFGDAKRGAEIGGDIGGIADIPVSAIASGAGAGAAAGYFPRSGGAMTMRSNGANLTFRRARP